MAKTDFKTLSSNQSVLFPSNLYSCRKIAKALQENIYFMWILRYQPNFRTINCFAEKA